MSVSLFDPLQSVGGVHKPTASGNAMPSSSGVFQQAMAEANAPAPTPAQRPASGPAGAASEFDPFAVVRSGAVAESNSFVQALEHLFGIAEGSLTGSSAPVKAADSASKPLEAASAGGLFKSTAEALAASSAATSTAPARGGDLSASIDQAVKQSTAALQSSSELESTLSKLVD